MTGDPLEVLGAIGPIVAATAGIVGGLVALAKNVGKIKTLFARGDQTAIIADLRLLADTRLEMIHALTDQLAAEKSDHAKTREQRDFARMSADESERRLNDFRDRMFLEHRP